MLESNWSRPALISLCCSLGLGVIACQDEGSGAGDGASGGGPAAGGAAGNEEAVGAGAGEDASGGDRGGTTGGRDRKSVV